MTSPAATLRAFDRGDYPLDDEHARLWRGYLRGHVTLAEYHRLAARAILHRRLALTPA